MGGFFIYHVERQRRCHGCSEMMYTGQPFLLTINGGKYVNICPKCMRETSERLTLEDIKHKEGDR
jgi:hypothetical protein